MRTKDEIHNKRAAAYHAQDTCKKDLKSEDSVTATVAESNDTYIQGVIDALEWVLDDKFGEYSLHYFIILKHFDPGNMDPRDYSLLKRYGYVILHPHFDNIMIDIFYDEQGKIAEINPQFETEASNFINGLHLKKKED